MNRLFTLQIFISAYVERWNSTDLSLKYFTIHQKLSFFQKSTQKFSEAYSEPNQKLSEAVGGRCSVKIVFSRILQNSQENVRVAVFF